MRRPPDDSVEHRELVWVEGKKVISSKCPFVFGKKNARNPSDCANTRVKLELALQLKRDEKYVGLHEAAAKLSSCCAALNQATQSKTSLPRRRLLDSRRLPKINGS